MRRAGAMVGLLLIAIGSGGIKPCVSAFGADQFGSSDGDQKAKGRFFAIFYWAINLGSLFSMIITPILRGLPCARNRAHSACSHFAETSLQRMPFRRIPLRRKSLCRMTKSEKQSKTCRDTQNPQAGGFVLQDLLTLYNCLT